ncbi:trypsin-like serine protease [Rhodobacter sp. Har01]|uniref:trypsin-like serine peptidase n=1 Tax=Rhodobacter sp. Har01 TaxID=2883999 RepID=UPI001D0860C7|nr:trypsin-like peptidase domain-containing protein [Rhodobacter sp. Har01]MCB6179137.1 trypsin-like serine protease [Rhodobacter sp. Har01]
MPRRLTLALALCLPLGLALPAAAPVLAQDTGLIGMPTADDAKGWQGVGKLLLGDHGFCTAALIAPQIVLTAAHCLFDKDTGARTPDGEITFQAGWRNGRAEAYRGVRRSVAHPDYAHADDEDVARVAYDVALLELDQPILLPQLLPFSTARQPGSGDEVSVVSYAHDRSEIPSIEEGCAVLSSYHDAMVLSCDIDFGSSGAPVFLVRDGVARVVSVISAKAELDGKKVALAVPLDAPLAVLQAELAAAGETHKAAAGVRIISGGDAGAGAKFVSP